MATGRYDNPWREQTTGSDGGQSVPCPSRDLVTRDALKHVITSRDASRDISRHVIHVT